MCGTVLLGNYELEFAVLVSYKVWRLSAIAYFGYVTVSTFLNKPSGYTNENFE